MRTVTIKSFDLDLTLKNRGIELDVTDEDGKHLGDLIISKARLEWCKGRKHRGNGVKISWPTFIKMMDERR